MYTTTPFWFGTVTSATVLAKTIAIASTSSTYVRASFRLPLYFAAPSFFPFSELRASWVDPDAGHLVSISSSTATLDGVSAQRRKKSSGRMALAGGEPARQPSQCMCVCAQTDEPPHRLPDKTPFVNARERKETEAGNPKKRRRARWSV